MFQPPFCRENPDSNPHTTRQNTFSSPDVHDCSNFCVEKVSVAISANLWYVFVLQGSELMKYGLLKAVYDCFYIPPGLPTAKQEIEDCHQSLIDRLDKPERKLVLQIIDAKDRIAEDISIGSFISGFELAWKLSAELNHYENERSVSRRMALGPDARFTCKKEEEQ